MHRRTPLRYRSHYRSRSFYCLQCTREPAKLWCLSTRGPTTHWEPLTKSVPKCKNTLMSTYSTHSDILPQAPGFFQLPIEVKTKTQGYSAFDTELILGRTAIPKESIYFFRKGEDNSTSSPSDLEDSIKAFHDASCL